MEVCFEIVLIECSFLLLFLIHYYLFFFSNESIETLEMPDDLNPSLIELSKECWSFEPDERPSMRAIHRRLSSVTKDFVFISIFLFVETVIFYNDFEKNNFFRCLVVNVVQQFCLLAKKVQETLRNLNLRKNTILLTIEVNLIKIIKIIIIILIIMV